MAYAPVFPRARIKALGIVTDEVLEQSDALLPVKEWELVLTPEGEPALVLRPRSGKPVLLEWNTESIVHMAKTVLHYFDPTTEEQILDALERIEARLSENGE